MAVVECEDANGNTPLSEAASKSSRTDWPCLLSILFNDQGTIFLTVGRLYIGNDITQILSLSIYFFKRLCCEYNFMLSDALLKGLRIASWFQVSCHP